MRTPHMCVSFNQLFLAIWFVYFFQNSLAFLLGPLGIYTTSPVSGALFMASLENGMLPDYPTVLQNIFRASLNDLYFCLSSL